MQKKVYIKSDLRHLFLELTLQCIEHCFHCGSNCLPQVKGELSTDEYKLIPDLVKRSAGYPVEYDCSHYLVTRL